MQSKTHAKGEGSTKRAIRRGFELVSGSSKGGLSSSPSSGLTSAIVILLALTLRIPLPLLLNELFKQVNREISQKELVGFEAKDLKCGNLKEEGAS